MTARYLVAYWIESPSPYLVVDTQPDTDGTCVVVGGFTATQADTVADALNEKGRADAVTSLFHEQAALLDAANAEIARLRDRPVRATPEVTREA